MITDLLPKKKEATGRHPGEEHWSQCPKQVWDRSRLPGIRKKRLNVLHSGFLKLNNV
jgi:hypothetical protein